MTLALWKDLSPFDQPLKKPSAASPHILVIGSRVTGLTSAWVLLDRGYRVTVLSCEWVNSKHRLTSQTAGALWEYPPAGAKYVTETEDDLVLIEDVLRARFQADAIVNFPGLGAKVLAGDRSVYPIRGGLVRVVNDGIHFPKVDAALTISADVSVDEIIFLVPRNDNILLIGGIAELHRGSLDLTLDSPIIKRMRKRCEAFSPGLENARLDPEYPFAQGLRPFRRQNVRVERELP
ncbi:FAD dependent oxidoreductase [Mycena venus]|uniref:FAD dependent oxidoreductase n=1 Tax=Mycena venus TaxID=2733690 RepID=A0A8H6Z203_9AGAR|nr:FAD dependent oxidoreductase [Mycena venus]